MVVTHNDIINAIAKAEDVSLFIARARANDLGNGITPCDQNNNQLIEINAWIDILNRAEYDEDNNCIDSNDIWNIIQKVNAMYRETDCDTNSSYSRNSSSGGGGNPPSGYVERVLGVNVDNTNPSRPVVTIYVDGVTITGTGTQADPFVAVGGGGGTVISVNGLTGAVVLTTTNIAEGTRQYFTTARVLATALTGLSITGSAITSSDTVLQAFGKLQNQINGLIGGVTYQGAWNASTNSPALTSSVGTKGYYYVVSVAGSTNLNGITDWKLGDWAIFNGSVWEKIDNTDAVISVNGQVGAVSLGLQQITNVNNSTAAEVRSSDGAGNRTAVGNGYIDITTSAETVRIQASNSADAITLETPNKAAGTYTLATTDDIPSGGVTSVQAGTNISVDNTNPASPIVNSLSDRYKTTSTTSNSISNGSKTFTVDANLSYIPLQEVLIVFNSSNHMHGTVTSYSGTTLIVDVKTNTGSGTYTSWSINLDGTPVDALTGGGTTNELAYFTAGQVVNSLPVASYPNLTEISYVKGVTSAIQTQLDAKQATLVSGTNIKTLDGVTLLGSGNITTQSPISDTSAGTAVTGTTSNTYSKGLLIAANSRAANNAPQIDIRCAKTGTAGTMTLRVYWNTSNNLTGAILIALTAASGATARVFNIQRIMSIIVANGTGAGTEVLNVATAANSDIGQNTSVNTTAAIDWTAAGYLICAVQNSSAADSTVCNFLKLH